jgi:precorrin-2 dehydrogenase/sirohydrochlorin ferrochelatase
LEFSGVLPVALDLARLPTLLVGPADAVHARRQQLEAAGAGELRTHICALLDATSLPSLDGIRLLMICAQELEGCELLVAHARQNGLLLWMEDRREYCDFHLPASVRRGDLTISISTGGRSPALARRLRRYLEQLFPEDWAHRLDEIAAQRDRLRGAGAAAAEINSATDRLLAERGWL